MVNALRRGMVEGEAAVETMARIRSFARPAPGADCTVLATA